MKILFFADIVGRIGRQAVKATLPDLRRDYEPDLIIANCENLAQGKGITTKTIDEMIAAGVNFFTSGNHIWSRPEAYDILRDPAYSERIIRPANYPKDAPGQGSKLLTVGDNSVLVINFLGRVFSNVHTDDPFTTFDDIIAANASVEPLITLVDFHAEATSEKVAFGWYAAGRATAVWGTHTHVATRDERILPGDTAYITDVGMCGFRDGVIGIEREPVIQAFKEQLPAKHVVPTEGETIVNAILIETDGSRATKIEHISKIINIKFHQHEDEQS